MTNDRPFSHPNFGKQVRIEQTGREVAVIFVADTQDQADSMAQAILTQLTDGAINITMMGEPISVTGDL